MLNAENFVLFRELLVLLLEFMVVGVQHHELVCERRGVGSLFL